MLHHSTVPGYFDRLKFVVAASLWMVYGMFMLCCLAFLKMLRERHHMSNHGRERFIFPNFLDVHLPNSRFRSHGGTCKSSKIQLFQVLKPMVVGYPGIPILGNPQLVYRIL